MTFTDYLLNITLVGLVILQIRGHRITRSRLLFPVVITAVVALQYLHGIPTAGNDLLLVVALAVMGGLLGSLAAVATSVKLDGAVAFAKAGGVAAVLWVVGIGARMAFYFWGTHGGESAIARFSATHHITSAGAWAAAFILMALAEVLSRTGILFLKSLRIGAEIPRGGFLRNPVAA